MNRKRNGLILLFVGGFVFGFMRSDAENFGGNITDGFLRGGFLAGAVWGSFYLFDKKRKLKDYSNDPKITELMEKYGKKTTEELESIVNSLEHEKYSDRACFVMKKILAERKTRSL